MKALVLTVILLFLGNAAAGQEESVGQYGALQMIASEISDSYAATEFNIDLTKQTPVYNYVSSVELIERYGTFPDPELQLQSFEDDPSDLQGITSRDVYIFGRPAIIFLADDDTFLNLKLVNGG